MNLSVQSFHEVFPNYDASSQLEAIQTLVENVFAWRDALHGDIKEAERNWSASETGLAEVVAEAKTHDLYLASIYRDAAAVQAVVGAIAPFVEGFLVHAFEYLKELHGNAGAPTTHERWSKANALFWNPRRPNGLVQGLRELQAALDLADWLKDDYLEKLEVLFVFRNRSLHLAYEWPPEDVAKFAACVDQRRWNAHIEWAQVNEKPWVAYLNDAFLTDLLDLCKELVLRFEGVVRRRGGQFIADPGDISEYRPDLEVETACTKTSVVSETQDAQTLEGPPNPREAPA